MNKEGKNFKISFNTEWAKRKNCHHIHGATPTDQQTERIYSQVAKLPTSVWQVKKLNSGLYTSKLFVDFHYVVGSKSFRPDVQKPRQMENAVRDI